MMTNRNKSFSGRSPQGIINHLLMMTNKNILADLLQDLIAYYKSSIDDDEHIKRFSRRFKNFIINHLLMMTNIKMGREKANLKAL